MCSSSPFSESISILCPPQRSLSPCYISPLPSPEVRRCRTLCLDTNKDGRLCTVKLRPTSHILPSATRGRLVPMCRPSFFYHQ